MSSSEKDGNAVNQRSSVRKHFYLITEHEDEKRHGGISVIDGRLSRPLKNEEAPIRVLNDEKKNFEIVGKQVGMGYHDFESEEEYEDNDRFVEVTEQKLAEIDTEWLEKAGHDPEEVTADGE